MLEIIYHIYMQTIIYCFQVSFRSVCVCGGGGGGAVLLLFRPKLNLIWCHIDGNTLFTSFSK